MRVCELLTHALLGGDVCVCVCVCVCVFSRVLWGLSPSSKGAKKGHARSQALSYLLASAASLMRRSTSSQHLRHASTKASHLSCLLLYRAMQCWIAHACLVQRRCAAGWSLDCFLPLPW